MGAEYRQECEKYCLSHLCMQFDNLLIILFININIFQTHLSSDEVSSSDMFKDSYFV